MTQQQQERIAALREELRLADPARYREVMSNVRRRGHNSSRPKGSHHASTPAQHNR